MRLIKGENLTQNQIRQVKEAFIYRWTVENLRQAKRLFEKHGHGSPTIEPVTDEKWIKECAFWIKNDGTLADRHAESVYMADDKHYSREGWK